MTFALALVFLGVLMLYCSIANKSLRAAIVGRSVDGAGGSLLK